VKMLPDAIFKNICYIRRSNTKIAAPGG